jgi:hypothetical protein
MEPKGSLPHSQEPDQSSPHHPNLSLKDSSYYYPPTCLGLLSGLFLAGFPTNNLYTFLFSPIQATCPTYFILFDLIIHSFINYIWRRVQITKLLVMQFSPLSCHLILLRSNYPPRILFSNTLRVCSSLNVRDQVSVPYRTTGRIIVVYILIFGNRREDRRLWTEW